jgi:hypothetical protein
MAHFKITIDGNIDVEVSKGKVFQKGIKLVKLWPFIKLKSNERIGYLIKLDKKQEYLLLRNKTGEWIDSNKSQIELPLNKGKKWEAIEENDQVISLKKAIENYEGK